MKKKDKQKVRNRYFCNNGNQIDNMFDAIEMAFDILESQFIQEIQMYEHSTIMNASKFVADHEKKYHRTTTAKPEEKAKCDASGPCDKATKKIEGGVYKYGSDCSLGMPYGITLITFHHCPECGVELFFPTFT